MSRDKADAFLRAIRRSQRGRLKVYLGYCAGVGKTYQMLQEGKRLQGEGIDVVIGLLETHGRVEIAGLAEGLEVVPRQKQEYRGISVEEMNVDAVLARRPQVALIDELAHTNVPGSRNTKRYEDVQDILAAGIHVITTLNVQHLESLYHTVEQAVRVKVRERLPDSVLAEADQIVDVDLTPEDLRKRLEEGRIYPRDRSRAALEHFFQLSNLEKLRELTLRELAAHIDSRRRDTPEEDGAAAPDQVMVCLSSRGPQRERLLRYASRLAGKLNRNWYAVYVQTRSEEAAVIDARTQNLISDTLTLAKQLGAMVFTYKGDDVAGTILRFAREYRVGHIVLGTPGRRPWWQRFGRKRDVLQRLIRDCRGVTIIVLDTREQEVPAERAVPEPVPEPPGATPPDSDRRRRPEAGAHPLELAPLLSERRILIWDEPVPKEEVLRALAGVFGREDGTADPGALYETLWKRELQGSTFFNEGAAFPHARLDDLKSAVVALGLTRQGVSDVLTEKPIETVFLILTPARTPDLQTQVLGLAARAGQNRQLLHALRSARGPEEAMRTIRGFGT